MSDDKKPLNVGMATEAPITVELRQHQIDAIEHAWRRFNPSDPEYEIIADLLRETGRLDLERELARSAEVLVNQVSRLLSETNRKSKCIAACNQKVPAEGAVCDDHNPHPPNSLNWHRRKLGLPTLEETTTSNATEAYRTPDASVKHRGSPPLESKCKWDEGCDRNATHGRYCEEHVKAYRVEDNK